MSNVHDLLGNPLRAVHLITLVRHDIIMNPRHEGVINPVDRGHAEPGNKTPYPPVIKHGNEKSWNIHQFYPFITYFPILMGVQHGSARNAGPIMFPVFEVAYSDQGLESHWRASSQARSGSRTFQVIEKLHFFPVYIYIYVCVCGCFCSSRRHCPFKRFMAKWGTPCVVRSLVWRRLHPEKWGVWCRWLSSMIFATSEDYRSLKNRLITWFSGGFTECLGCIQGFCGTILHG